MSNDFPLYTTDYISGAMSLRKPQTQSLKILEEITNAVQLRKGMNLKAALGAVHAMYPICSDFERDFMFPDFCSGDRCRQDSFNGSLYRLPLHTAPYQELFRGCSQYHDF